jgi:hypothetical protein
MNAENPVQIDLFGVSATRTKDTRLAEHIGGYFAAISSTSSHMVWLLTVGWRGWPLCARQ